MQAPPLIYSVFLPLNSPFGISRKSHTRNSVALNPWPAAAGASTHWDIAETGEVPGIGAEK